MSRKKGFLLVLLFGLFAFITGAYGENDPAGKGKESGNLASLTVFNKSSFPVIGVYLQPVSEASRLAAIGRPEVGKIVHDSDIKPGDSATVSGIEPDEYVITIVKANGRGDIIRQDLKAGTTFTYAIE